MSKTERIKSQISYFEKLFFGTAAILVTLIAWISTQYSTANVYLVMAAAGAILLVAGICEYARRRLKQLWWELDKC